jgi:hypothetical protein
MPHAVNEQGLRKSRALILVLVGVLLIAGVSVTWLFRRDREQEWRSGGTAVDVEAGIRAAAPATYGDTLSELGLARETARSRASQMVVARVRWSGTPDPGGSYAFILLDDRVVPARPVGGYEAVGPEGATGPHWDGRYEVLPDHYPWLVGITDGPDGSTDGPDALGLSAVPDGEATLSYWLGPNTRPTSSPHRDFLLAVVYVADGGEVRWAKQVPLEPLT